MYIKIGNGDSLYAESATEVYLSTQFACSRSILVARLKNFLPFEPLVLKNYEISTLNQLISEST